MKIFLSIIIHLIFSLVLFFAFVWCGFGFFYQLPVGRGVLIGVLCLWSVLGIIIISGEWRPSCWYTRGLALIVFVLFSGWWATIRPSLVRDWQPELSRTVEGRIEGSLAHVQNIRNFKWITPDEGEAQWFDATYDLDTLTGMKIYLSYWMGPYIAHTLVGFEFSDGRELVFSSEIRREKGESFSAIGGFFKQFELAMIAATPEDIIRLRTDVRREDVVRYTLKASPKQARALFEIYLDTANKLAKKPAFYNTLTANCTTVVFDMARVLNPGIPLDWRIVLSGKLASYLYSHNFIDTSQDLSETVKNAYISHRNPVPAYLVPE